MTNGKAFISIKNSSFSVRVFSNADHVELYLNDQFVTNEKSSDAAEFLDSMSYPPYVFELPRFVPGTLKVIAFIEGKKVAEHRVSTPKTAKKNQP